MAKTIGLQNTWHAGMKRDVSRSLMPAASLWDAVDVIANYGAPLRQRGGWKTHSASVSAASGSSATYIAAGIQATFSTSAGTESTKDFCVGDDGHLYSFTDSTVTKVSTATRFASQNPIFHGGAAASAATAVFTGLVIVTDSTLTNPPAAYDGSSYFGLHGTPPTAALGTVYKDYTVLGNGKVGSTYYPNRIWFSPPGDPDCATSSVTAWDTTDSWIDFSNAVRGLGSTRNALLVFHDTSVTRIRGSIPPPDEDMVVDDGLFGVGLYDPLSIATHQDTIVWAAPEGIFRTDGALLDDLTRRGGMQRYWLDLTADATSAWSFAGGVHRDTYFLTVMDGSTFKDAFKIDLLTLAWTRLSNVDAKAMWSGRFGEGDELYWGRRGADRVCRMSTIFQVGDSTYKNDGDGDAVVWSVETGFFSVGKPGAKRIRRAFIGHDVADYATDNPDIDVSYILTPEETSYTSAGSFTETATLQRKSLDVRKQGVGIAFMFSGSNAGDRLLYDLEVEAWPYEQTRRI